MANRPWRDFIVPFDHLTPAQRRKINCYVVGHELCTRGLHGSCFASEDFLAVDLLGIDPGPGAGLLPTPALRTLAASVANLNWDKLQSALSFSSPEWLVFREDVEEGRQDRDDGRRFRVQEDAVVALAGLAGRPDVAGGTDDDAPALAR